MAVRSNDFMGTVPEKKLAISMALPLILSMLVQALYNIVDSVYVGMVSEDALSAVSMAFPFQTLIIALFIGIAVGMTQVISKSLGERKEERAKRAAAQGMLLSLICSAAFAVFGIFFSRLFFTMQNAPAAITDQGSSYLFIVTLFSVGVFVESAYERMLIATGHTKCTMICQITGAVLNIVLDPIMIFGLFGFPKLGVTGAAIATVLSMHIAALMAYIFHRKMNSVIRFGPKDLKPEKRILKTILSIGSSAAIKQGAASVVLMFMNAVLLDFTSTATAVYGAFNRIYLLICTPGWAIMDVLVVLAAYNLGIRNKKRLYNLFKYSMIYVIGITAAGSLLVIFFPQMFLGMFSAGERMLAVGMVAFPILACHLPFQMASSTMSAMMQGLGEGGKALAAGVIERFALPMAFVLTLASFGDLNLVWWAFVMAEVVGIIVSAFFMRSGFKAKADCLE